MFLNRNLDKLTVGKYLVALFLFSIFIPFFSIHANEQTSRDRYQKKSYLKKRIIFKHLSLEQGLSQSTVIYIVQDRKGFIWFRTGTGLNQYDGHYFKAFKHLPDDSTSLNSNWIADLYVDQQGKK